MIIKKTLENLIYFLQQVHNKTYNTWWFWGGYYSTTQTLDQNCIEADYDEIDLPIIWEYDWILEYYKYNWDLKKWNELTEEEIKEKLKYYRFTLDKYLLNLVKMINHTLKTERKKLVSSEIYKVVDDPIVVDFPKIPTNTEEMEELLLTLPFSNKYITFTDEYIWFKLNTKFLSNRKNLKFICSEVINDQKYWILEKATFNKLNREWTWQVFSWFNLQQLNSHWYITVLFTEEYKNFLKNQK